MIGIISNDTTILTALCDLLQDIPAQPWQPNTSYKAVLLVPPPPTMETITAPIISLGLNSSSAALVLPTPIHPAELHKQIKTFLSRQALLPHFENKTFLFDGHSRLLMCKLDNRHIPLTEKENAILCCLANMSPKTVTRSQLLADVWHYHPDIETHTVETHIYALRQKIGPKADSLIQNDTSGYFLVG